ncbi:flagellar hook-associated protein FlgK [Rhodovulum sp. 12E13]|uniref:FlgK family flagellar hook-associated protein n=1 Tax=Rhodovulum sp. 12E13 TaxID=2203891 RepID=UPI000E166578|nr:flagellar basal body rod C-terminal domain-containing protein [Rhodovulum sp. 12E13]RDC75206.1 flagellar hook-associated protein FlgK [Rhodovulum sp. 12E13]
MSLSFALFNAASGLRAQGRAAELVSGNVANALTPGYARRELMLTTDIVGGNGGVRVSGISRVVDPVVLADRRLAEAGAGRADTLARALKSVEQAIGEPSDPGSLSELVARFSSRLIEASSQPDSELRLRQAVAAARGLAEGVASTGAAIQQMRSRADTSIAGMVERVNTALQQVDTLNDQILRLGAKSRDSSALQEARQQAIDSIAEILPIREVQRANGAVALFTGNGATLLDGRVWELGFTAAGTVQPEMTVEAGALSSLTIGGVSVDPTGDRSLLGAGALMAQFELRDIAGPEAQRAIDAIARDLVERFQDPAVDPSLGAGVPGLFTDGGLAFDPAAPPPPLPRPYPEEGLAQRLSINPRIAADGADEVWRLRDGLGPAAAPGPVGDPSLIVALGERLGEARPVASGPQQGQERGFAEQVALFLSGVATTRQAREGEAAFEGARLAGYREAEAAGGVDTDDEMQKLLVIEQNYAANARVIQTIDLLMDELRRI